MSVRRRASGRTHYNFFRDYDPTVGRYLESDPIGLGDGANTYAYVRNDPLSGVDPRGQSVFKIIKLCATGYKVIKKVGFKQAVRALRGGEDVLAPSTKQAREVANSASDCGSPIRDPIHPDPKTGSPEGRMPHYHPRVTSHSDMRKHTSDRVGTTTRVGSNTMNFPRKPDGVSCTAAAGEQQRGTYRMRISVIGASASHFRRIPDNRLIGSRQSS